MVDSAAVDSEPTIQVTKQHILGATLSCVENSIQQLGFRSWSHAEAVVAVGNQRLQRFDDLVHIGAVGGLLCPAARDQLRQRLGHRGGDLIALARLHRHADYAVVRNVLVRQLQKR